MMNISKFGVTEKHSSPRVGTTTVCCSELLSGLKLAGSEGEASCCVQKCFFQTCLVTYRCAFSLYFSHGKVEAEELDQSNL